MISSKYISGVILRLPKSGRSIHLWSKALAAAPPPAPTSKPTAHHGTPTTTHTTAAPAQEKPWWFDPKFIDEHGNLKKQPRTYENNWGKGKPAGKDEFMKIWKEADKIYYGPQRDLVNYPPPELRETDPKTRIGFIPETWFTAFYPKTGITGPYVFGFTALVTAFSKEFFIVTEHFGELLFCGLTLYLLHRYLTKPINEFKKNHFEDNFIKNGGQAIVETRQSLQLSEKAALECIEREKALPVLYNAKREQIGLQLELAYRQRLQEVHRSIKNRLDFYAESEEVKRRYQQEHLYNWVNNSVLTNITPEMDRSIISKCISDLKTLAEKNQGAV